MGSRYGLQIRTATPADAEGIAELLASAGHAMPAAALATRLEAIRREHGTVLLALEWGPPSGLVVVKWFHGLGADQPVAQINTLLVAPAERRRGIGRLLLKAAAQAARSAGCGALHLPAAAAEPSLRDFAGANGFDAVGATFLRRLRKGGARDDVA